MIVIGIREVDFDNIGTIDQELKDDKLMNCQLRR